MSDMQVDPLQIDNTDDPQKNDEKSFTHDDYLNRVKRFLTISSPLSESSESDPDPNYMPNQCTSKYSSENKNSLRRSSRTSASLYKDYSHVTTFTALPSIKLTLSLRNLPKWNMNQTGTQRPKKSRKLRKSKLTCEEINNPITTEELTQILEVTECSNDKIALDHTEETDMHKTTETRLTCLKKHRKKRLSILTDTAEKQDTVVKKDLYKNKGLPKIRKKKRLQTEGSKKFQKLKNACRKQFRQKEFTLNKITNDKSPPVDQPREDFTLPNCEPVTNELADTAPVTTDIDTVTKVLTVIVEKFKETELQITNIVNKPEQQQQVDASSVHSSSCRNGIAGIGKHNLPISIPERRSNIAEPLHNIALAKVPSFEKKVIASNPEDCKDTDSRRSSHEEIEMIYVKSPEALNASPILPTLEVAPCNPETPADLPKIPEENGEVLNKTEEAVQEENTNTSLTPDKVNDNTCAKKTILFGSNILSCPGYVSTSRRNSISTADLFSYPAMALKRAVSTGILHKIQSPVSRTLKSTDVSNSLPVEKQKRERLNKNKGPKAKRLRDNSYVSHNSPSSSFPVYPHPRYAAPPSTYSIIPPKNPLLIKTPIGSPTFLEQCYPPSHELYNLARMHCERLARYNAPNNGHDQQVIERPLSIMEHVPERYCTQDLERNFSTLQPAFGSNDTGRSIAPARDKHTELHVTQCHSLNESRTSSIQNYINEHTSLNATHDVTNKRRGHTANSFMTKLPSMKLNNQSRQNYSSLPPSITTSPVTISDSSSGADTDIELEVDVVGNDFIDEKATPTYSRILIKQKHEINGLPVSSAVVDNSEEKSVAPPTQPDFVEEIRKLHSVIELLLERASPHCSEKDLQQIQQIIQGTTKPQNTIDSSYTSSTGSFNDLNSIKETANIKQIGQIVTPRITSVTSLSEENEQLPTSEIQVVPEPIRQLERKILHNSTSRPNSQIISNNVPSFKTNLAQYAPQNMYRSIQPINGYKEVSEPYAPNYYSSINIQGDAKQSRMSQSLNKERQVDQKTFFKEFAKIMYAKEINKQTYQDMYLKHYLPTQQVQTHSLINTPHPSYASLLDKGKPLGQAQGSVARKHSVLDRPPSIYNTNPNTANIIMNPTDFNQPAAAGNNNILGRFRLPKQLHKRNASTEELIARSPDSGYISPSRKISPHLEQRGEPVEVCTRRHSVHEPIETVKLPPHTITTSKIAHNLTIPDQNLLEQIIVTLLPKLHHCGTLDPEQYVKEMYTLEKEQCPPFLLQFYTYVTKKQIFSNQLPISFKIFLEFKSAGKLKMYENSFSVYLRKRDEERFISCRQ